MKKIYKFARIFACVLLYFFGFEIGIGDLIVFIPDHCLPINIPCLLD